MAVRVRDGQRLLIEIPAMSRQDSRTCTSQDQDAKWGGMPPTRVYGPKKRLPGEAANYPAECW
jgi:hypothetical protein